MKRLDRRHFITSLAGGAAAAALTSPGVPSSAADAATRRTKPNIIFILADDLGYGDVGCFGQELIQTPNIDRIAAEGLRFTQCYAGSTVCAPSRSCLMTGQHTGHTTVRANSGSGPAGGAVKAAGGWRVPLRADDVTVAEVLKAAGYATGITGKWGLAEPDTPGVPTRQGFDWWFGYLNQNDAHEYYPPFLWRNEEKVVLEGNKSEPRTDYSHDLFTREALDFVRRQKNQPFFLYLAYTIPHASYQVPSLEPYASRDWPETQKCYAAMITRMDRDIGMLMALLKKVGMEENTVVFFTSDNGVQVEGGEWERFKGKGPFRDNKGSLYEGGIRVPMIVRWPGKIKAGTTSNQVWAFWDFLPTAAEIAGATAPPNIDGISMLPALLGKPQKDHDFLYWEFPSKGYGQAVRMGDWKGVKPAMDKPTELYNLADDVGETRNIAGEHADIVAKIETIMKTEHVESKIYPSPAAKLKKQKT